MKEKIKYILIGVLIGFVALPTITLGGTFVSSLIQGKTVEEAVQVLAEQIDILRGRTEILESQQKKEEACRKANEILEEMKYIYTNIPPYTVIIAGKVDDYISATQDTIKRYEWLVESQKLLCPPTQEGIRTYCNRLKEIPPEIHGNRSSVGNCESWQNRKENIISGLKRDCKDMEKVNYAGTLLGLQNKLEQLQELKSQYLIQEKICKQ